MRLLDLFCGAGGAAKGYADAGFDVVGVDIRPQPHYPFEFHQEDALAFLLEHGEEFDVIHASPPCQAYTSMQAVNTRSAIEHPALIAPTREALTTISKPFVIENVPGAASYMRPSLVLCGSMFGLRVRRHRIFEANLRLVQFGMPRCRHIPNAIAVYGDHPENAFIHRRGIDNPEATRRAASIEIAREAMGIDWMDWREITQAIPPAYTRYLGEHLMSVLQMEVTA